MNPPRFLAAVAALTMVTLAVAGCSDDEPDDGAPSSASTPSSSTSSAPPTPAVPDGPTRTVMTGHGEIAVPESPTKVMALSGTAAGMAQALGVDVDVVVNTWGSDEEFAGCHPWLKDSLAGRLEEDVLGDTGFDFEAIAALKPDVIVAVALPDDELYARFAAIAPVVTTNDDAVSPEWDKTLETFGKAFGKTDSGKVVEAVSSKYAAVAAKYPGIKGKTFQFVAARPDAFVVGKGTALTMLGLEPGTHQTPENQNRTDFSWEKLGDLNADLLIMLDPSGGKWESLQSAPKFKELPSVVSGNVHRADMSVACALNGSDPIGLEWVLSERLEEWAKKLNDTAP